MGIFRLLAVAVGVCAVGGCSGGASDGGDPAPVALVKLAQATQGRIAQSAQLYGEVARTGANQAVLSAPVEAVVETVAVPQGAAVRAGQLVARLRPSPATRTQAVSAQAQAKSSIQALARAERLRKDGLTSDADVETARAAAIAAKSQAAALAGQVAGLALRAPHAGYVDAIGANPGDLVQAGAPIVTLSNRGARIARFGVDPSIAAKLSTGTPVTVRSAGGGAGARATIASISPVADAQTRLASVVVRLPAGQGFAVGQALTASVPISASGNAITVPYAALLDDGGQPFVYVVSKGVAHRHDVSTGPTDGKRIAITKGVTAGDQVVVSGGTGVEDGMKVRFK